MHRGEVLSKLKDDETVKGALEILLDSKTEKELDFCTAYFGFQDDIKHLKENINQGNIQVPSVEEESAIVNPVARAVKVLCKRKPIQDELDFFLKASPNELADMLYRLNCLENSDMDGLIRAISDKASNRFGNIKLPSVPFKVFPQYYEIYSAYTALSMCMHNYPIQRIDRKNSYMVTYINKFMRMTEIFHGNYTTAAYYDDTSKATSVKQENQKIKQKSKTRSSVKINR